MAFYKHKVYIKSKASVAQKLRIC